MNVLDFKQPTLGEIRIGINIQGWEIPEMTAVCALNLMFYLLSCGLLWRPCGAGHEKERYTFYRMNDSSYFI